MLKALENPQYFENFAKKYSVESAKAELSKIDDSHEFHEQISE